MCVNDNVNPFIHSLSHSGVMVVNIGGGGGGAAAIGLVVTSTKPLK